MTKEEYKENFIKKSKEIHKNENLDYSEVVYINNRTKVKIIDKDLKDNGEIYGEYYITPSNHLKGQSHPLKRAKKISNTKKFTTEKIIELFKKVHKEEKLDYSEVVYKGIDIPVKIICKEKDSNGNEYGEFYQTPRIHLKGCTHPRLSIDKNKIKNKKTTEYCIDRIKKVHGDKYDLSKINYKNNREKIEVICKKHGSFLISPENIYYGKGCPKCNASKLEQELIIEFENNNIDYEYQVHLKNDKRKSIDFFIPSKNIFIECQGEQHYTPTKFTQKTTDEESEIIFENRKNIDAEKYKYAKENNCEMIYYSNKKHFINKDINIKTDFYKDKIVYDDKNDLINYIKKG